MTSLIRLLAAVAAGVVLASGTVAQNATSADQIEHHIVRNRRHALPLRNSRDGRPGVAASGMAGELDCLAESSAFAGQRRPARYRT